MEKFYQILELLIAQINACLQTCGIVNQLVEPQLKLGKKKILGFEFLKFNQKNNSLGIKIQNLIEFLGQPTTYFLKDLILR